MHQDKIWSYEDVLSTGDLYNLKKCTKTNPKQTMQYHSLRDTLHKYIYIH